MTQQYLITKSNLKIYMLIIFRYEINKETQMVNYI